MTGWTLDDLEGRLADAAGPIVVKELRQGLRAKAFVIFFALLLTGCLVVALVAAAEHDHRLHLELGPRYFRLFLVALGIVEFFVIPYTAFRAMSREREDETWVLLVLTGLGARRIVRGKASSALAQGLLYASACGPFVLFSYYLNGVDLPTVLVALGMSAAWSCVLVCSCVAAATQAQSRIGRAVVHFGVLGVLSGATVGGVAFAAFFAVDGARLFRDEVGFRAFCASVVVWSLTTAWVALEGAASGLALPSENAARGPRVALSVQLVLALAAAAVVAMLTDTPHGMAAVVGAVATAGHLGLAGIFAVSEHDGFPSAFARERAWFKPGAARSFALVVALLALSTAAWLVLYRCMGGGDTKATRIVLAAPLFVLLYLSLGVLLGRLSPLKVLREPVATRIGVAAALLLGTALPMFASVLTGRRANAKELNVLSPLLGVANINNGSRGATTLWLAWACALLFGFFAFAALTARDSERRS